MAPKRRKLKIVGKKRSRTRNWEDQHLLLRIYCFLDKMGVEDMNLPKWVNQTRKGVYAFLILTTIVSSLNIVFETLPTFATLARPNAFSIIEMICILIYTIDWLTRLVTTPIRKQFLKNPLNWMDFIGLIPFWLALGGLVDEGISKWIIMLRVTRLVQAVLTWRHYDIVLITVEESTEVGMLMVIVLAICLPIGGMGVYYAERGTWNNATQVYERPCSPFETCEYEPTPFRTGQDGMWFFISVATTLGMGDIFPKSDAGKIVASLTMCVGVFILAFPIMILAVNFKEEIANKDERIEKIRSRDGRKLVALQKEHTTRNDNEEEEDQAAAPAAMDGDILHFDGQNQTMKPVYFLTTEDGIPRRIRQYNKEEARYNPLFFFQRKRDGAVFMESTGRGQCEVAITLVLDSRKAQREALAVSNAALPDGLPLFKRCRHFDIFSLHMSILRPPAVNRCEMLKDLRLTKTVFDEIDSVAYSIPVKLELTSSRTAFDEQKGLDFVYALHRCRLMVTAALIQEPPKEYDVPIFYDLLKSTNLYMELKGRKNKIVYMTEQQLQYHLNGVHHLLDVNRDDGEVIMNRKEITKVILKAVKSSCATAADDANEIAEDAFLYDDVSSDTYYGVFVSRLEGRSGEEEENDGALTLDEAARAAESKDRRILCTVTVKTVKPVYEQFVLNM